MTTPRPASPLIQKALDEFYLGDKPSFIEKLSYIEEVMSRIPKYSSMDPTVTAEVSNMALAASIVCADLIHDISREAGMLETMAKAEEADAYYRSEATAVAMKKIDSQRDKEYVVAQKKLSSAKSFLDFLRREYNILTTVHYHCKELIKGLHSIHSAESSGKMDIDDLL
jgi:hypothetical protein